jgi:hypothetical protein
MSEEGVRLKRERHEILGLQSAKRGIPYPGWRVLPERQLLPALPRLFALLGDDPWRLFRFLRQHHCEFGGRRALEALRRGRIEAVLAAWHHILLDRFACPLGFGFAPSRFSDPRKNPARRFGVFYVGQTFEVAFSKPSSVIAATVTQACSSQVLRIWTPMCMSTSPCGARSA